MAAANTPAKPFLRWAGGKRRLLPVLTAAAPAVFGDYYEPCLGGGAMFFALRPHLNGAHLADSNADLIAAYTQLQGNVDEVVYRLKAVSSNFGEEAFYRLRSAVPTTELERAVRFIAYNRTCFNGLFRVNTSGGWNVPYGKLTNPRICDEPLLRAVSAALQSVQLEVGNYQDTTSGAQTGDFVYFDPPYLPASDTASFSKYMPGDFDLQDQRALADFASDLSARGVHVLLSNADTPLAREVFSGLPCYQVSVQRSISAAAGSRGVVNELLACNVPLAEMADKVSFRNLATAI